MNLVLSSKLGVDALIEGLRGVIEVVPVPLDDVVARLDGGSHPVLYLDPDSSPEDQAWAMLDALKALALGPAAATSAHWVRRLRAVS